MLSYLEEPNSDIPAKAGTQEELSRVGGTHKLGPKGLSRNSRYISLLLVRCVARHALPWATSREERGIAPTVTAVHPIGTVVLGQTLSFSMLRQ
jgi:hypothetical protein